MPSDGQLLTENGKRAQSPLKHIKRILICQKQTEKRNEPKNPTERLQVGPLDLGFSLLYEGLYNTLFI